MKNMLPAVVIVILVLVVAGVAAKMGGWLTFSQSDDKATISIETKKAQEDTEKAIESAKELIESPQNGEKPAAETSSESGKRVPPATTTRDDASAKPRY